MEKLTELVKELIKRGIIISGVDMVNDELSYEIQGFAKSGVGKLFVENGQIKLGTRYNQVDDIDTLEDIVNVAYDWDCGYCRKDDKLYTVYGVSENWKKLYEEFNLPTDNLR